jgi:hypothetical protein
MMTRKKKKKNVFFFSLFVCVAGQTWCFAKGSVRFVPGPSLCPRGPNHRALCLRDEKSEREKKKRKK